MKREINKKTQINWVVLSDEEVIQNWIKLLEEDKTNREELVRSFRLVNTRGMMPSYFFNKSIENAFSEGLCSERACNIAQTISYQLSIPADF